MRGRVAVISYLVPRTLLYFPALVGVMTMVGLGFLLPNNLRIWFELHKPEPDRERVVRLNRYNICF